MEKANPFEFDAAPNLDPGQLVKWYIEDHNYSRFIQSSRNVLINGERGSGKSMTLIYHSLIYKKRRSELNPKGTQFPGSHAGIYVPCNTPLSAKEEYKLLNEVSGIQLSETALIASIVANIAREFEPFTDLFSGSEQNRLFNDFSFYLETPEETRKSEQGVGPFELLRREIHARLRRQQRKIVKGDLDEDVTVDNFSTLVLPILSSIRKCEAFKGVHLSILIDDIQDLNPHQQKLVNSWIAYRDHTEYSIKASVVGLRNYNLETAHGGTLLENHDYISVDLQRPVQNNQSEYGQFARQVVKRRLAQVGITRDVDEYFPVSEAFVKRLDLARSEAEAAARARGYKPNTKQYRDFVYKQRRAFYFRDRHAKSNKPIYSGFETLGHLSTGVIRNLLQPCFFMYEKRTAQLHGKRPDIIPADVQDDVVKEQSDRLWDFIESNLERRVAECSGDDARRIKNLFVRLAEYFRQRLLNHASEPRVVTFIVSERVQPSWEPLEKILRLCERAQILYVRTGTSKRGGARETYYVPNRMLWPRYGLDANGQHGRASLRARDLWAAAEHNEPILLTKEDCQEESSAGQGSLFDDE